MVGNPQIICCWPKRILGNENVIVASDCWIVWYPWWSWWLSRQTLSSDVPCWCEHIRISGTSDQAKTYISIYHDEKPNCTWEAVGYDSALAGTWPDLWHAWRDLKSKVDFYDHKDKFQNNFQKIILDMFRCTTPSSEDKNWLIIQLNKYEADS